MEVLIYLLWNPSNETIEGADELSHSLGVAGKTLWRCNSRTNKVCFTYERRKRIFDKYFRSTFCLRERFEWVGHCCARCDCEWNDVWHHDAGVINPQVVRQWNGIFIMRGKSCHLHTIEIERCWSGNGKGRTDTIENSKPPVCTGSYVPDTPSILSCRTICLNVSVHW